MTRSDEELLENLGHEVRSLHRVKRAFIAVMGDDGTLEQKYLDLEGSQDVIVGGREFKVEVCGGCQ